MSARYTHATSERTRLAVENLSFADTAPWHPAVEHVTVISGTFNLGMGEKFDTSSGRALTAGSFAFMPPGMRHFAWAKGETVVQVHGMGPWKVNYVNSADDPRNKN